MPDTDPDPTPLLIYGANGYTGRLVADEAVRRGLRPVLAGRSADAVREEADARGLAYRAFSVDDAAAVDRALVGMRVVLNCAGPFVRTAAPLADACIRAGVHYLDVTGEIPVFEAMAARDAAAREGGVVLLPGVGFDVVPSDCLAAHLHGRLPDAERLTLAFRMVGGGVSRGTLATAVEGMGMPGAIRRGGRIVPVRQVRERTVDFGRGQRPVVRIPWGDVSTAWHSTAIPEIETYAGLPAASRRMVRWSARLPWLFGAAPVKGLLRRLVRRGPEGPDAEARASGASLLWGEAVAGDGRRVEARMRAPEGYALTARTAVRAAEEVLAGRVEPGFRTPSLAFGADWILGFDGVEREDVV